MIENIRDKKDKTRIVIAPDNIMDGLPDDVKTEFEDVMKRLASGEELGTPCDFEKCDIQLICPECKSSNVIWMLEKNSQEVTFVCNECGEKFWQTVEEYKKTISDNPECVINKNNGVNNGRK